jgi:hypothetical protein
MKPLLIPCTVLFALLAPATLWAACEAKSGATRARVLELYTSQGCSSCPPAERWLAELTPVALARAGWIPLAFHVDYWDRLGWRDPYAQPAFSVRQRARASKLGWVYTPQFLHDGVSIRPAGGALPVSNDAAAAKLTLVVRADGNALVATTQATVLRASPGARLYLALFESGLKKTVTAGENAGRVLTHDYVVRRLAGPFAPGDVSQRFDLAADWQRAHMGVAAWIETPDGQSLQAVAVAGCQSAR